MTEAIETSQSHLLLGPHPRSTFLGGSLVVCTMVRRAHALVEARHHSVRCLPVPPLPCSPPAGPLAPAWLLQRVPWERPRRGICSREGAVGALCQDRCTWESQSPEAPNLPQGRLGRGSGPSYRLGRQSHRTRSGGWPVGTIPLARLLIFKKRNYLKF